MEGKEDDIIREIEVIIGGYYSFKETAVIMKQIKNIPLNMNLNFSGAIKR